MGGPRDFAGIPVIDVGPLLDDQRRDDRRRRGPSPAARRTADDLGRAARELGFLHIVGCGVAPYLFDDLLGVTAAFFAQPHDEKMRVYIAKSSNHRGYVPEGEEIFAAATLDRKEAFDLGLDLPTDDPDFLAGNPLLGPNQWPDLPGFRTAVTAYYRAVFDLGRVLLRGFSLALGQAPDHFDAYVTKPPSQLRLIHYPFVPSDAGGAGRPGIGAHTDYECFTLLRSTSPGLEVMNGAGNWIDVPPVADAFTVNIGDLLELWTNGEFVATSHRVREPTEERYSFPLFFNVDYHTVVEPMARFVTPDRPRRPGLVDGEHLVAQTAQSFVYQQERLTRGEITLPARARPLSSFGQEARHHR